jgi:hypothetical protein
MEYIEIQFGQEKCKWTKERKTKKYTYTKNIEHDIRKKENNPDIRQRSVTHR